jgi:hypothetical protein
LLRNFPIFHVRQQNRRCECSIRYWIGIRRIRKVSHIESGHTQRLLQWLGVRSSAETTLTLVSTMGLYWICMIGVSYLYNIFLEGSYSATVLSKDEKQTMKAAQKAVLQEPSTSKSSRTPCPRSQAERFRRGEIIR